MTSDPISRAGDRSLWRFALGGLLVAGMAMAPVGCVPHAPVAAEQERLERELRDLLVRNHWAGVDGTYRRLVALPGGAPTFQDHWNGALAAEALGRPSEAWLRLQRAAAIDPTDAVLDWSARILAFAGEVSLKVEGGGAVELVALDMPMEPEWRNTIEAARVVIKAEGEYRGLLPLGRYVLGDKPFSVDGGPLVSVRAAAVAAP